MDHPTGVIYLILILISFVFSLFLWTRVQKLTKKVETLSQQVSHFLSLKGKKEIKAPEPSDVKPLLSKLVILPNEKKSPPVKSQPLKTHPQQGFFKSLNLEQKIVSQFPIWIGGISLILAGLFMVKYSIETGLLSPGIRLIIGGVFGCVLLFIGDRIQQKPTLENYRRISHTLSGAGIAILYICLYGATSFYTLIPPFLGFCGMAIVTGVAVVLSLRQGPSIALLGLI